jgi:hypothetical protein
MSLYQKRHQPLTPDKQRRADVVLGFEFLGGRRELTVSREAGRHHDHHQDQHDQERCGRGCHEDPTGRQPFSQPAGPGAAAAAAEGQAGSQPGCGQQEEEPAGVKHQPCSVAQDLAGEVGGSGELLGAEQDAEDGKHGGERPAGAASEQGAAERGQPQSRIACHPDPLALAAWIRIWPPALLRTGDSAVIKGYTSNSRYLRPTRSERAGQPV